MSSSRTRSWIAALVLVAMTTGCVCPEPLRLGRTCKPIRCESAIAPGTMVIRHSGQHPIDAWPIRQETVKPPGNGHEQPESPGEVDPVQSAPVPSGLTIDVIDLADPVPTGGKLTYKIIVSNDGTLAERNATVVVTVPDGMIPIEMGTDGPTITGQIVRFDPVAEIGPGEQREFQVEVEALMAGQWVVHAELTSDNLSQPLNGEASTEVF